MTGQRDEWALDRDAFSALLRFLDDDPQRAADEYERLRQRLIKLFRWRGCLAFEEYTDLTVDRVARMIASGVEIHTTNRYALFHGVALNVLREHWRRAERQQRALDIAPPPAGGTRPDDLFVERHDSEEQEARLRCLRQCLKRLPAPNLEVIRRYYAVGDVLDKEQRKRIASDLGVSPAALRVRAHRIRTEIGQCVGLCLERR